MTSGYARSSSRLPSFLGAGSLFAALTLASLATFYLFLGSLSWEIISALTIGSAMMAVLSAVMVSARDAALGRRNIVLLLWAFLLCSENFFIRWGTNEDAFAGALSLAAYAEATTWVLVFLVLLVPTLTLPHSSGGLFRGQFKWMTLFAGVSLLSALYSPRQVFSLAWGFKLLLVVLALKVCASHMETLADIRAFLTASLVAFAFLAIEPVILVSMDPSTAFDDGRLGGDISTTHIAAVAAALALLALTVYSSSRWKFIPASLAVAGLGIMVIAGGKTAFAAAILGGLVYFALQRKAGVALAYLLGIGVLALLAVSFTPLAVYLRDYTDAQGLASLTGRTDLWAMAFPFIWKQPLLGHGFVASKFFAVEVSGLSWMPGHMHNWALEILYNSGIVGLVVFVPILYCLVRNLVFVLRSSDREEARFQLAAGCLGMFVMLFADGLFEASFGGKPGSSFMLLLAIAMVSERLAAQEAADGSRASTS